MNGEASVLCFSKEEQAIREALICAESQLRLIQVSSRRDLSQQHQDKVANVCSQVAAALHLAEYLEQTLVWQQIYSFLNLLLHEFRFLDADLLELVNSKLLMILMESSPSTNIIPVALKITDILAYYCHLPTAKTCELLVSLALAQKQPLPLGMAASLGKAYASISFASSNRELPELLSFSWRRTHKPQWRDILLAYQYFLAVGERAPADLSKRGRRISVVLAQVGPANIPDELAQEVSAALAGLGIDFIQNLAIVGERSDFYLPKVSSGTVIRCNRPRSFVINHDMRRRNGHEVFVHRLLNRLTIRTIAIPWFIWKNVKDKRHSLELALK